MRVLVTGMSGFVGSALAPALRARGHEARAASRGPDRSAELAGCDAVVHLANIAHTAADRELLQRVNVEGTRELAEQAAAAGVRRLVYISSIKALGEETFERPFDGSERPAPRDEYGRSKLAAEQALREVAERTGLETVILRPPLVYGPGVKANFLALMRAIDRGWPLPLASVHNRRSLIYVGNLADAIVRCLEAAEAAGKTYLVSDGAAVSTPELVRSLARALGRPARLIPFPPRLLELGAALLGRGESVKRATRSLEIDDAAIRRDLRWRAEAALEKGAQATARWYRGTRF